MRSRHLIFNKLCYKSDSTDTPSTNLQPHENSFGKLAMLRSLTPHPHPHKVTSQSRSPGTSISVVKPFWKFAQSMTVCEISERFDNRDLRYRRTELSLRCVFGRISYIALGPGCKVNSCMYHAMSFLRSQKQVLWMDLKMIYRVSSKDLTGKEKLLFRARLTQITDLQLKKIVCNATGPWYTTIYFLKNTRSGQPISLAREWGVIWSVLF